MTSQIRIEPLSKDNYDSWSMQVEALMTKNDTWKYANGEVKQPVFVEGDVQSQTALTQWQSKDKMAKSDLILSISPSELQQIRGCTTSREIWLKLESIHASKGPARKATLLKQLTLQRLQEGQDVREHLLKFFDAVDKLKVMGVEINEDLLSIMLLYSLPPSYENFRCAIESHDKLPNAEVLKVKIIEETEARMQKNTNATDAMVAWKGKKKYQFTPKKVDGDKKEAERKESNFRKKIRCSNCRKFGHKEADCYFKKKEEREEKATTADDAFHVSLKKEDASLHVVAKHNKVGWCVDSGCTSHICGDETMFMESVKVNHGRLNLASNDSTDITGIGKVDVTVTDGTRNRKVTLEDTLLAPDVRMNLLSVSKITDRDHEVLFRKNEAIIRDYRGEIKVIADRIGDLYYVREANAMASVTRKTQDLNLWHQRLGHVSKRCLLEMAKKQAVRGIHLGSGDASAPCDICIKGKQTKLPFQDTHCRSKLKLKIVHTDICGPMRTASKGGARYLLLFVDDYSRWIEIFFLRQKSDALGAFQEYKSRAERFTGERIKYLQSDNGREFCNEAFDKFLKNCGIQRRLSAPYTPEQNGTAERMNRTLIEMARCILFQGKLDNSFWAEAVNAASYLRNRCASRSLNGRTPYELWYGKVPQLEHLRTIGTEVYVLDKTTGKGKFDARSEKGVLVGYSQHTKGYRVWIPTRRAVVISRDVRFLEENGHKQDLNELTIDIDHTKEPDEVLGEESVTNPIINEPEHDHEREEWHRAPGRPRMVRTGSRGRPRKQYHLRSTPSASSRNCDENNDQNEESSKNENQGENLPTEFDTELQDCDEEEDDDVFCEANLLQACSNATEVALNDALTDIHAEEWKGVMVNEINHILERDTWKIVNRPKEGTVIGSRFVLTSKLRPDGTVGRRKARLVAKGFSQQPGIDFKQSFAPVARLESLRILVALSARLGMTIRQIDAITAYLNSYLDEPVYMEVPETLPMILKEIIRRNEQNSARIKAMHMLSNIQKENKVCMLERALYGLRQAGRQWNIHLDRILKKHGLNPTAADPCLYTSRQKGKLSLILVYVDDILLASEDDRWAKTMIKKLSEEIPIKDLGKAENCLGIKITQGSDGIKLSQGDYIMSILKRFGMECSNPISTPMDPSGKREETSKVEHESKPERPYRQLIGALMYLAVATRPDIAYVASYLGQFNHCHTEKHWAIAKRVLRYLQGTLNHGLHFRCSQELIMGYTDADWGGCQHDRRSYTGYAFLMNGAAISWRSIKQPTVALSSTEAEYMALSETAKEAIYLKATMTELGLKELTDVTVLCDNRGAISLAENPVKHTRTKHIDIRHHFVRQAIKEKKLCLEHVSTSCMAADILTKALPKPKHVKCMGLLGLTC